MQIKYVERIKNQITIEINIGRESLERDEL